MATAAIRNWKQSVSMSRNNFLDHVPLMWILILLGCCWVAPMAHAKSLHSRIRETEELAKQMISLVESSQFQQDKPFVGFKQWDTKRGIFPSNIYMNFHGNPVKTELRHRVALPDINPVIGIIVMHALTEAYQLGGVRPSEKSLTLTIQVVKDFQDKNRPYENSVLSFWEQELDETTNHWYTRTPNLKGILEITETFGPRRMRKMLETVSSIWRISPDVDSSMFNIGLGSLMYTMKEEFLAEWETWDKTNPNFTSVFDFKEYTYRPFSGDSNINSIDPRSYFMIRSFLDRAKREGKDVVLTPVWMHNMEEKRKVYTLGDFFNSEINNIDMVVCANVVYHMTACVLSGLCELKLLEDPLLQTLYHNNSALVADQIENDYFGRPDISLLYYTSEFMFLHFVSRTVELMDAFKATSDLPVPVMHKVYRLLKKALKRAGTISIVSQAKKDDQGRVFFDSFLGNDDTGWNRRTHLFHADDRVFTTATATNALLYIWTKRDEDGKPHWRNDTPIQVKTTVIGSVDWLVENTLSGKYKLDNCATNQDQKGDETASNRFPANRFEYINGTQIKDWSSLPEMGQYVLAVEGYIEPEKYVEMLKDNHFGYSTPLSFDGYNNGTFICWTSVPITQAYVYLALVRYSSIVE